MLGGAVAVVAGMVGGGGAVAGAGALLILGGGLMASKVPAGSGRAARRGVARARRRPGP
jgi:hypothetical protein